MRRLTARWWERWWERWDPRLYLSQLSLVSSRLREVLVNNSPRRYLTGFYPIEIYEQFVEGRGGRGVIAFIVFKPNSILGLWEMTRQWVKKVSTKARYWELWDCRAVQGSALQCSAVQCSAGSRDSTLCLSLLPLLPGQERGETGAATVSSRWLRDCLDTAMPLPGHHTASARYQPNNGRFHPEYNWSLGQARLDQGFTEWLN